MKNYLKAIRLAFSRELMRHLAARMGESENAVGKAVKGRVPMVLCQLVIQTGEGEGRALFSMILKGDWSEGRGIHNITEVLAMLGGGPENSGSLDTGEGLLCGLFGANWPGLNGLMSAYTGLRPASAVVLLRLVAAVLAVGLAQYAFQYQLTALRLSEEFGTAKNQIYNWLPSNLPRWLGFQRRTAINAPHVVWAAELARPYWVLLVLAAAGAVMLALLVLGAFARPARSQETAMGLLTTRLDSVWPVVPDEVDSDHATRAPIAVRIPTAR